MPSALNALAPGTLLINLGVRISRGACVKQTRLSLQMDKRRFYRLFWENEP